MSIKILTDSGSDYEKHEIDEKNIDVIPIPITFKGRDYLSGVNLSKADFFALLEEGDDFPKTAQPSPQVFIDYFEEAKKNGDEVIAIMLSVVTVFSVLSVLKQKHPGFFAFGQYLIGP